MKSAPTKQGVKKDQTPKFSRRRWIVAALGLTVVVCIAVPLLLSKPQNKTRTSLAQSPPSLLDSDPTALLKPQLAEIKPASLKELLALSFAELDRCDIARMNLLCAEELRGAEGMNVDSLLDTLDTWAKHVESETRKNFHRFVANSRDYKSSLAYYRMMMLSTVLQQDFGNFYNPERAGPQLKGIREPDDVFFANSRDVFLNGLLTGKHSGTCASMPILYAVVAQRLGYPVKLATTTGHFFVRYEEGGEHLNVEATSIGFNTYPDEHYRHWPFPVSDADVRLYGLLRSRTKRELLGDFLTLRAATLTSMKRFDEAAEMWVLAARRLPETPALNEIVRHAGERAANNRNANRWDALAVELAALPVIFDDKFAEFQDRKVGIQRFMNQSTNLVVIEAAVKELKDELDEHRKEAMLASDAPRVSNPLSPGINAIPPELVELLANLPAPRRIQIAAERIPHEYWDDIPAELQKRLIGLTSEDRIVAEMHAFHGEQINRQNQAAMAVQFASVPRAPHPLPPQVRPEYLPAEWREEMPEALRKRLERVNRPELVQSEIRRYQLEEQNKRSFEEAAKLLRQNFEPGVPPQESGSPIQIEIIPPKIGTP